MNIRPEHLHALRELGYTDTEASFLYLAATHSGYFTQRQFLAFAQVQKGGLASRLIAKALECKHLRAARGAYHTTFTTYIRGGCMAPLTERTCATGGATPRNLFRLDFSFSILFSLTLTSATSKPRLKRLSIFTTPWVSRFRACQAASTRAFGPFLSLNATS